MKGKILDFSIQNSTGIISGNDGQRYNFVSAEWKSNENPSVNQIVDFSIDGNNALGIYVERSSNVSTNSYAHSNTTNQISETSILAIVSLISGLIGLFTGFVAIIAIITGHIARSNIETSNGQLTGGGIALAGLILGYLTVIFWIFIVLVMGAAIGAAIGEF